MQTRIGMQRQRIEFNQPMGTRALSLTPFAPGDMGASLILDFQNQLYGVQAAGGNAPAPMQFTDLVTFTRASNAWYFNSAGVLTQASTDIPRFDYDAASLQSKGLLIETASTNMLLRSTDLSNSLWIKRGTCTVTTATGPLAPDGTNTGNYVQGIAAPGSGDVYQSATAVSTTRYEPSIYLAKATSSGVISLQNSESPAAGKWLVDISLLSTSYQRITRTHPAVTVVTEFTGYTNSKCGIDITRSSGAATLDIYAWGGQLELGVFSSSTILTTSATVTRSADVASITPLTPWFNTSAGTLYANYLLNSVGINTPQAQLAAISDSGSNSLALRAKIATTGNSPIFVVGNGTTTTTLVSVNTNSGMMKAAGAYNASSSAECANAEAPVTGATGYLDAGLASMGIGSLSGGQQLSGWLASIKFYPTQYNSAALQALTT